MLPTDLEASAKASGALVRRRGIQSAQDLLRMIFAYAICDWPLRLVGAWLVMVGLADISDVAILQRLRIRPRDPQKPPTHGQSYVFYSAFPCTSVATSRRS